MGLFEKKGDPIFWKEDSHAEAELQRLNELREHAPEEIARQMDQDIKLIAAGLSGEKNVAYELKNSHIPMYVLHDLYLVKDELSAQIDYLVLTKKCSIVIECKNLFGNIEINSRGDFIRTLPQGRGYKKECIYSPITQNQRHMELIRDLCLEAKGAVMGYFFDRWFPDFYKPIVVLANPKTVLNDRYAKKEVKAQVIRADHLIETIRELNRASKSASSSDKQMKETAEKFLEWNQPQPMSFVEKYEKLLAQQEKVCPLCGGKMVKRVAKKGAYAGEEFWGCENFPHCRHMEKII
ncbi:NERD domain-containing protein [Cuneatibacter sp. NSJ-177]|uniref:NERD domain-containing protein n=1 Tax=Cuneatibacter sp. NSJ-177 TaxID=2931401 RepID=UPI001FD5E0E7|nr:NERD domain-containing protein [Cuneatibacter sp. NSJ-177]MCJ7837335.1 NERD domain-containing protein [Cuneatibacter sp. NSJ-177]